jgi:hypothetical protein
MSISREDEYLRDTGTGLSLESVSNSREGVFGVEESQFLKLGRNYPFYFEGYCMEDCLLRKAVLFLREMSECLEC